VEPYSLTGSWIRTKRTRFQGTSANLFASSSVTKKSFITLTPEEVAGENKVPPRLQVERDDVVEMGTLQPKLLFGSPFPQAHLQKGASLVNLRLLGLPDDT
jgi:hypothetical protein